MADDSGIDPRYAAQFQRGFDPARHPVAPPAPRPTGPVRLAGGPVVTAERVPPPPPLGGRDVAPAAVDGAPAPVADEPEGADDEPASTRPPLIEWLLPVAGLVLLAAALWLFGEGMTDTGMFGGSISAEAYAASMIRKSLPGPLLVAGMLAITAWVVLRGSRGRGVRP